MICFSKSFSFRLKWSLLVGSMMASSSRFHLRTGFISICLKLSDVLAVFFQLNPNGSLVGSQKSVLQGTVGTDWWGEDESVAADDGRSVDRPTAGPADGRRPSSWDRKRASQTGNMDAVRNGCHDVQSLIGSCVASCFCFRLRIKQVKLVTEIIQGWAVSPEALHSKAAILTETLSFWVFWDWQRASTV